MGGFVPVCASLTVKVLPKEMTWGLGIFQAANVIELYFGPVIGGVCRFIWSIRVPFSCVWIISMQFNWDFYYLSRM